MKVKKLIAMPAACETPPVTCSPDASSSFAQVAHVVVVAVVIRLETTISVILSFSLVSGHFLGRTGRPVALIHSFGFESIFSGSQDWKRRTVGTKKWPRVDQFWAETEASASEQLDESAADEKVRPLRCGWAAGNSVDRFVLFVQDATEAPLC